MGPWPAWCAEVLARHLAGTGATLEGLKRQVERGDSRPAEVKRFLDLIARDLVAWEMLTSAPEWQELIESPVYRAMESGLATLRASYEGLRAQQPPAPG